MKRKELLIIFLMHAFWISFFIRVNVFDVVKSPQKIAAPEMLNSD